MAVKIINPKPDASVVKRVACTNCGATLEYVPADTFNKTFTDYTGDSETYPFIKCPQCLFDVRVKQVH